MSVSALERFHLWKLNFIYRRIFFVQYRKLEASKKFEKKLFPFFFQLDTHSCYRFLYRAGQDLQAADAAQLPHRLGEVRAGRHQAAQEAHVTQDLRAERRWHAKERRTESIFTSMKTKGVYDDCVLGGGAMCVARGKYELPLIGGVLQWLVMR